MKQIQFLILLLVYGTTICQTVPDSSTYFYYKNKTGVDTIGYYHEKYSNGKTKECGWKIGVSKTNDLVEVSPDLKPELMVTMEVGEYKEYYKNGNLKRVINILPNDSSHQEISLFDKSGVIHTKMYYPHKKRCNCESKTDNSPQWFYLIDFENGTISSEGKWIKGIGADGLYKYYDSKGLLIKQINYKNGVKIKEEYFE